MPPFPKWLEQLSGDDVLKGLVRFKLQYIAVMHCKNASVRDLSASLGKSPSLLANAMTRWTAIPANYCVALEQLVGREVVTREWLNPDIFTIEG